MQRHNNRPIFRILKQDAFQFCARWGLKQAQLDKLILNIGELARRLLSVLPNHKEYLYQLMDLKRRPPPCLKLSYDRSKVDVLTVFLSMACNNGIYDNRPRPQEKPVESKIKKYLAPVAPGNPLCTAILM
jgi:hypothetical protein